MQRQMMQASLAYFAAETLRGPPEEPYYGKFLISEHHEEWGDIVTSHDRVCVLAPRDHGKTFFYNLAYPIWMAWKHPNKTGFIFSATQEQAIRILEDIKAEIEDNPKLQHLVPKGQRKKWSATQITLANGARIYARGFGTKVRGAHPQWIVCDDVLNDETAWSETTRSKQIDYFFNAITPMCVPGGQIIVVGTPFHSLDLYGELEQNSEYFFKRFQAVDKETGQALWPERYDAQRLAKRRREVGDIRFTREYLCLSISDDMSLFPSWLFEGAPVEQYGLKLGMPKKFWEEAGIEIYMGVDFAISSSVKADYTVIWVMGVDKRGTRWIVDMIRERGLSYQSQKSLIVHMARKYDPGLIFLESNQMQRIWGDTLIVETDLPVKKFITKAQEKHSLEKGLPSLRVLLENQKIRIPLGDERSARLMGIWKAEMQSFTFQKGKIESVGAHDDTGMAFWICDQAIRQGYFSFEEEDEEDEAKLKTSLDDLIRQDLGDDSLPQTMEAFEAEMDKLLDEEGEHHELTADTKKSVQVARQHAINWKNKDPDKMWVLAQKKADERGKGDKEDYVRAIFERMMSLKRPPEGAEAKAPEQPQSISIGYGDEEEDEGDMDDVFTGKPLRKGKGWKPTQGAPVPGGGTTIKF